MSRTMITNQDPKSQTLLQGILLQLGYPRLLVYNTGSTMTQGYWMRNTGIQAYSDNKEGPWDCWSYSAIPSANLGTVHGRIGNVCMTRCA